MSLHVLTHPWQVQDFEHGLLVKIAQRDLDVSTISVLADELFELVQESGQPNLSLEFGEVHVLPAVAVGKLFALERRLRDAGGQLVLCNVEPAVKELLRAEGWSGAVTTEPAEVREGTRAEAQDCFVVYVRDAAGSAWRPEGLERPVASCPCYEEAVAVREQFRQAGRRCIIRFVGPAGGGD
jgi:anti-anti-sigma factor